MAACSLPASLLGTAQHRAPDHGNRKGKPAMTFIIAMQLLAVIYLLKRILEVLEEQ